VTSFGCEATMFMILVLSDILNQIECYIYITIAIEGDDASTFKPTIDLP
jgi:hypothetical protein